MATKSEMLEMLEKEQEIRKERIIAEKEGAVYVSFPDAAVLNSAESYEPSGTGLQMRNQDGSIASTGKTIHAVNPSYFFANRYKVKTFGQKKKIYIVSGHTADGYRVIKEQPTGRCFIKTIPCAVISRDAETKELVFEKMTTITEQEFISDFTNHLDNKSMAEILPLIVEHGVETTASTMPI